MAQKTITGFSPKLGINQGTQCVMQPVVAARRVGGKGRSGRFDKG